MKYTFETFDNSEEIKDEILACLSNILEKNNCLSLRMPVYTCLNELLVNAVKANYKNLYFEEYSPSNNALDIIPYHKALQLFKLEMSTNRIDNLLHLAQEKNIKVVIEISLSVDNALTMMVTNFAEMTDVEKDNVTKKKRLANTYSSLSDYFIQNENDPNKEGGGLGIFFIVMMLKSFGLSGDHLLINTGKGITTSSITVPLTIETVENYERCSKKP